MTVSGKMFKKQEHSTISQLIVPYAVFTVSTLNTGV